MIMFQHITFWEENIALASKTPPSLDLLLHKCSTFPLVCILILFTRGPRNFSTNRKMMAEAFDNRNSGFILTLVLFILAGFVEAQSGYLPQEEGTCKLHIYKKKKNTLILISVIYIDI